MKKIIRSTICAAAAAAVCMGQAAFAQFTDMPEGEMGDAIQHAVDAGLIEGVSDTEVRPNDNITRAQMATIITRAFSAQERSDQTFGDVAADAWYNEAVSKAVAMGAFRGDTENNFNPDNNITFQETYIVIARVFGFEPYELKYSDGTTLMLGDCEDSVLDAFPDSSSVADWARDGAKYVVGKGGWTGIDGMLKPADYITRGQFALLMDSIVTTYINEPGTYTDLPDGLTMVRCGGVTIDGLETSHNLILTYGVDESGCKVTNSTVNGVTLVLGGVDDTPEVIVNEETGETKQRPDDTYISLAGSFYDVRVNTPFVYLDASGAEVAYYKGVENSLVSLSLNN